MRQLDFLPFFELSHFLRQLNLSSLSYKPSALSSWFDWLKDNTNFDQLILEHDSKGSYWIHVSCRKNRKANRHQVFYDLHKKC